MLPQMNPPYRYNIRKKNAVDYWRNVGGKQRALKTVQHRYKKVTCKKDLYRWESQVSNGGTKHEKLQFISKNTYEEFLKARKENKIVHDIDLKRWALKYAACVFHDTFRASKNWLANFKMKFNIVSRKITKFVTKKYTSDELETLTAATTFVEEIAEIINKSTAECVFNTDQSGFNLEFHAGRTHHEK